MKEALVEKNWNWNDKKFIIERKKIAIWKIIIIMRFDLLNEIMNLKRIKNGWAITKSWYIKFLTTIIYL